MPILRPSRGSSPVAILAGPNAEMIAPPSKPGPQGAGGGWKPKSVTRPAVASAVVPGEQKGASRSPKAAVDFVQGFNRQLGLGG